MSQYGHRIWIIFLMDEINAYNKDALLRNQKDFLTGKFVSK